MGEVTLRFHRMPGERELKALFNTMMVSRATLYLSERTYVVGFPDDEPGESTKPFRFAQQNIIPRGFIEYEDKDGFPRTPRWGLATVALEQEVIYIEPH
jgi:hypothetical protein